MARLNFDHAQLNRKKWSKLWKDQTAPNEFFSQETTNKTFIYLSASFILQNFKKILRANPQLWGCAIFGLKIAHLFWTVFFGTNHYYYFHLPIDPFHCANFKNILTADPELWGCAVFGTKMVHLPPNKYFFGKLLIWFSYLPIIPFIFQNVKKILSADPKLWGCVIFGHKMAHFCWWEFSQKTCWWAWFFQSCQCNCQKSKSDINLLMKHWRLKNIKSSLAESHFWL